MGYPGQGYPGQGRMGRDFAVDSAGHPLSTVPLSATSPAGGPGFRVDNKREENRQDDESESSVSTSRESYPDEAPADLPKSPFTNTITYSRAPPGGGQPQFYAGGKLDLLSVAKIVHLTATISPISNAIGANSIYVRTQTS